MSVVLDIASNRHRPALRVKPWLAADMPDLLAAMALEYPQRRLWSHPDLEVPGKYRAKGTAMMYLKDFRMRPPSPPGTLISPGTVAAGPVARHDHAFAQAQRRHGERPV